MRTINRITTEHNKPDKDGKGAIIMMPFTQRRLLAHSLVLSTLQGLLWECGGLLSFRTQRRSLGPLFRSTGISGRDDACSSSIQWEHPHHEPRILTTQRTPSFARAATVRCYSASANQGTSIPNESSILAGTVAHLEGDKPITWLVVGDGDLSYSAWLASTMENDDVELVATVLEDKETHRHVYKNSDKHSDSIISNEDHTVLFGVDATKLLDQFPPASVDRIIFNFPHWRGKANNRYNRLLLNDFLASAVNVLRCQGEIHVALVPGQGGSYARNMIEWRASWMAAQYAADHGLLLSCIEEFGELQYDLSSHRGVDRAFSIGNAPRQYIFTLPDGDNVVDPAFQVACRHELRIRLREEDIAACQWTRQELVEGDAILHAAQELVKGTGIRASVPMRDIVTASRDDYPLLVFLLVYSGESQPLTRALADTIRAEVEFMVTGECLQVAKANKMVSKPFPYPILDALIEERI